MFDVIEHAQMDRVNDAVRPQLPIIRRPKMVIVPGGAFQEGAISGQGNQAELPATGLKVTIQMSRMNFPIGGPFLHGFRVLGDGEFQQVWLIPNFNRFNEWSRGKLAASDGTDALAVNFRANGIRNSEFENRLGRRRQFAESHDVLPYGFRVARSQ